MKLTIEEVKQRLYELNPNLTFKWAEYISTHHILTFKCNICNYEGTIKPYYYFSKNYRNLNCPNCKRNKIISILLDKCYQSHNNNYSYPYIFDEYKDNSKHITAYCKKHDTYFKVIPHAHKDGKMKCPLCDKKHKRHSPKINTKFNTDYFKERAIKIYGENIFDFSRTNYIDAETPVEIKCNECGNVFKKTPHSFLSKKTGCNYCNFKNSIKKRTKKTKDFIEQAKEAHNNYYIYDANIIDYKNNQSDINVICPKHGVFKTNANNHLHGYGLCPECCNRLKINSEKRLYETIKLYYEDAIRSYYDAQLFSRLSFDIYIPSKQVFIEYQGDQHFKSIKFYGGDVAFKRQIERDLLKIKLCKQYNFNLIHFAECKIPEDFNYYEVIKDIDVLIERINAI